MVARRQVDSTVRWVQSNAGKVRGHTTRQPMVMPDVDYDKIIIKNNCGYSLLKFTPVAIGDLLDETEAETIYEHAPGFLARHFLGEVITPMNMHRTAVVLNDVSDGDSCFALVNGVVPGRMVFPDFQYTDDMLMPYTDANGGGWRTHYAASGQFKGLVPVFPGAGRCVSRYADENSAITSTRAMIDINSSGHQWVILAMSQIYEAAGWEQLALSATKKVLPVNYGGTLTGYFPMVDVALNPSTGDGGATWKCTAEWLHCEIYGDGVWEADGGELLELSTYKNDGAGTDTDMVFARYEMPGETASASEGGKISISYRMPMYEGSNVIANGEYFGIRATGSGTFYQNSQWLKVTSVGYTMGEWTPPPVTEPSIAPIAWMHNASQGMT